MELQFEPTRVYGLDGGGRLVAEITFPCTQPGIYTIDHTFVAPSLRGQGMADKLVRAALEQIRAGGLVKGRELVPVYHRLSQAERERLERERQSRDNQNK